MAETVFEQLDDADFYYAPDGGSNTIFVIVQHMAGNMRSRWTDFLTTDGEKPDRHRDREFVNERVDRAEIMTMWEARWHRVFDAMASLKDDDLLRTVVIREEPHGVIEAIHRQLTHYAYHVGQIAYIGKHLKREQWKTLSIPQADASGSTA